jgi:hypothetical protein
MTPSPRTPRDRAAAALALGATIAALAMPAVPLAERLHDDALASIAARGSRFDVVLLNLPGIPMVDAARPDGRNPAAPQHHCHT